MTLKFKTLIISLTMCFSLSAQYSQTFMKIGKKYVMEHLALNNDPDNLLLFAVLYSNQSSKIKFQTALIRMVKDQKPVIEKIDLESVENQKEEKVLILRKLKDNKILMMTETDNKKENAVIMRIISDKGKLLKSEALTLNCYRNQTRLIYYGGDEFYVSYWEYGTKTTHYLAYNFDLKTLNTFKYTTKNDNDWIAGFQVRNNKIFLILYDRALNFENIKTKSQITVERYDFSTSKFEQSAAIKSDYIINYTKYYYRPDYLEFFYLSCSNSPSTKDGVLCVTRINWNTMEIKEIKSDFNPNAKLAKISTRPYLKNKTNNLFHYLVFRNSSNDGYKIMMRLGTEKWTTVTQTDKNGGISTTDIYKDTFENTVIYDFDDNLNYTGEFELNNGFFIIKTNSSPSSLMNDLNGDYYMYTYKNDSLKQILFANSLQDSKRFKLYTYEIKNGMINTNPVVINTMPKKNCYYDLKHVHEISPGIFVIYMTNDKRHSYFLILNTN